MRYSAQRPGRSRRGLTLLEMMVTVALLILIMTIVVQIFQSATGAMTASRTFQELDQGLRRLDSTIRQDLNGVTARLTPPLNPKDNLGYLEYGENAFADNQGEDADDYLRFTTKAPEGHPFTGRCWVPGASGPILITSQYAEVIYFLRNGNLYRRVFLIAPERQSSLGAGSVGTYGGYTAPAFGIAVSWQGMNDLSAHPVPTGPGVAAIPILNTLGDLTNRENRAFYPRFANDFRNVFANNDVPDNIPDDGDGAPPIGNGVPDYYPTLYPLVFSSGLINEGITFVAVVRRASHNTMPFPYIYPGAYSRPAPESINSGQGWVHSLDPSINPADPTINNQSPLESGDSIASPGGLQTCWMFPTWRETMSPNWSDPNFKVNNLTAVATTQTLGFPTTQSPGLRPFDPTAVPAAASPTFLPLIDTQPFNDGAGNPTSFALSGSAVWEDDLIMTGVRSFDIKAYDNLFAGYVDLGWGDDIRTTGVAPAFLTGTPADAAASSTRAPRWTYPASGGTTYENVNNNLFNLTYAHEGRIPPIVADFRLDAQSPNPTYGTAAYAPQFAAPFNGYTSNIGDNQQGVIRLRRVWDSWSTDYTRAPASGHNPSTKRPTGLPFEPPIYPSYPPPYPMPLRGIQIQIRVVDPRSERIKTLTIRQDFSDKL